MERNFGIKLEGIRKDAVAVRFFSKKQVYLEVVDVKFYYDRNSSERYSVALSVCKLDNDYKILSFSYPANKKHKYTSLNFIVRDITAQIEYGVRIKLDSKEINIVICEDRINCE